MICKLCSLESVRNSEVVIAPVTGKKQYRHTNEDGRRWNGRVCPDCTRIKGPRKKAAPKVRRADNTLTKRRCRGCDCKLTKSRYFNCEYCANLLPEFCDWSDVCGTIYDTEQKV